MTTKKTATTPADLRPVLVTTDKDRRGVFAGLLEADDGDTVILREVHMCVYWSPDVRGVLGLAAGGPTKSCRISKAAPRGRLNGVTAVVDLTPEAWAAWQGAPWS